MEDSHRLAQARHVKREWSNSPQCLSEIESMRVCLRTGVSYYRNQMREFSDLFVQKDNVSFTQYN